VCVRKRKETEYILTFPPVTTQSSSMIVTPDRQIDKKEYCKTIYNCTGRRIAHKTLQGSRPWLVSAVMISSFSPHNLDPEVSKLGTAFLI